MYEILILFIFCNNNSSLLIICSNYLTLFSFISSPIESSYMLPLTYSLFIISSGYSICSSKHSNFCHTHPLFNFYVHWPIFYTTLLALERSYSIYLSAKFEFFYRTKYQMSFHFDNSNSFLCFIFFSKPLFFCK